MNFGISFARNEGVDKPSDARDEERKRREVQQARRRIARRAAELERLQHREDVHALDLVPRPQRPWQVLEAIAHVDELEGAESPINELDSLLHASLDGASAPVGERTPRPVDNEDHVPIMQNALSEPAFDAKAMTRPPAMAACDFEGDEAPVPRVEDPPPPAATDLSKALRELALIEREMEALHERSRNILRAGASIDPAPETDATHFPAEDACDRTDNIANAHMQGGDVPAVERQRLEARLAFLEGFYADLLDGPREQQQLLDALARIRAAPKPQAMRVDAPLPQVSRSTENEKQCADEREAHALDSLAAWACDALAAGVPAPVLLSELAMQLAQSHMRGTTGTRHDPMEAVAMGPARLASRERALAWPSQAAAALRLAAGRVDPADVRKALLDAFLHAQEGKCRSGEDVATSDVTLQDAAVQRHIDALRAMDTAPLAALRVL